MRWLPNFLNARDAGRNGDPAREAGYRAMYARPDALPLPDEAPRQRMSWRVAGLGRSVAKALRPRLGSLRRRAQKSADSA
jgi:hypothetical protein